MSNSTVIGTTSNFYGVATFQSQPIITSTILANNDNSTNIATTAWANSFLTYAQTQPNTWTGAQTFTTANVSVLNVFKTSVDTINASSITSDMTIGANLNGGSLTLGGVNSVTNITSGTINASIFKLFSGVIDGKQSIWLDTIQSNLTPNMHIGFNNASQIFIGGPKTNTIGIGGDAGTVNIAASGLSATGNILIGSGANNAVGSYIMIGDKSLPNCFIRGKDVLINYQQGTPQAPVYTYIGNDTAGLTTIAGNTDIGNNGLPINGGVSIASGVNGVGSFAQMGSKSLAAIYLRARDILINDGNNTNYINNGNIWLGNAFGSGHITINKPLTPAYSYPVAAGKIGEVKVNTTRLFTTATSSSGQTLCAVTLDYAGVYMMQFNAQIYFPGSPMTGSYVALYVNGGTNVDPNLYNSNIGTTSILPGPAPNNFYYGFGNTWIVQPNTGSAYYYITSINLPIGTVIDFVYLCAVRIA